ncbi:MAG TPA: isochorismatase family cysteine hydrolase [Chloroflexota bacterium]|nr:isochorismatase family cysteine hydrolase [Chloroflexota bacterium]
MAEVTIRLEAPEPRALALDPARTAVVVVDVENEFCTVGGKRYMGERGEAILAPLAALLDRARAAGVPVIYVHSVRDPDNAEFTVFKVDEHLLRGSWGAEYCDAIAPRPGEPVVDKECHDCFNHTELEGVLARLGVRPREHTVIVTGVALGVCVSHAVLGFSVRDYWVAVPMDCAAAKTAEQETVAYQPMLHSAYAYNVAITRSDLIEFRPGVGSGFGQAVAASAR